jgi:hypothetical protein
VFSDINECATEGATLCPSANNVVCQNTEGSYKCKCADENQYQQIEENKCKGEYKT